MEAGKAMGIANGEFRDSNGKLNHEWTLISTNMKRIKPRKSSGRWMSPDVGNRRWMTVKMFFGNGFGIQSLEEWFTGAVGG